MKIKDKTKDDLIKEIRQLQKENKDLKTSLKSLEASEKIKGKIKSCLSLLHSAVEAVLLVNEKTGKITDANPSAVKLYGYPKKELLGKSFNSLKAKKIPGKEYRFPVSS